MFFHFGQMVILVITNYCYWIENIRLNFYEIEVLNKTVKELSKKKYSKTTSKSNKSRGGI